MKFFNIINLWIIILIIGLISCKQKDETKNMAGEEKSSHLVSVRSVTTIMTVQSINLEERLFTLQYSEGNVIVVKAAPDLVGIENIKVGDEVEVKYLKSLTVYVTSPDSSRPTITEKKTVKMDTEGGEPVEYIVDIVEKVSTVMAIDYEKREAMLKDSEGIIHEVDVSHEVENLENVSIGDQVVYHSTESIAIHIAKVQE